MPRDERAAEPEGNVQPAVNSLDGRAAPGSAAAPDSCAQAQCVPRDNKAPPRAAGPQRPLFFHYASSGPCHSASRTTQARRTRTEHTGASTRRPWRSSSRAATTTPRAARTAAARACARRYVVPTTTRRRHQRGLHREHRGVPQPCINTSVAVRWDFAA